jgi:chaperonin GroES
MTRRAFTLRTVCTEPRTDPVRCLAMTIRPLGNNLFIRRAPAEEQSRGGIIIPDTAQKRPHRGTVVAAGPGVRNDRGDLVPNEVRAEDVVLFAEGLGRDITVGSETLVIISSDLVLGVIES